MGRQTLTINSKTQSTAIVLPEGIFARQDPVFGDVELYASDGSGKDRLGMASGYYESNSGGYFACCDLMDNTGTRPTLQIADTLHEAIQWLLNQIKQIKIEQIEQQWTN